MSNIMENIMNGGSYANITKFDKDDAAELFNNQADIVGTTMGPDANPSLIQFTDEDMLNEGTAQDGCYATKDGYTVLQRIRHLNKYHQALINTSFATTKLNNETSGDGTTTSYVLFAKLFYNLYNNSYKHVQNKQVGADRRMTDGQFAKLLRKSIKAITHRIDTLHRTPIMDYDQLINIARVSLNNDDENLKPLKALLTDLKKFNIPASSVNISITNSNLNSCSYSVNSGFEFSSKVFLRSPDVLKLNNTRLIMLERNLETNDQTHAISQLMEATRSHFLETGETFLVAMSVINDTYIPFLESYYRNQEQLYGEEGYKRHLFLVEYNDTKGISPALYKEDMLIYFNSSTFNITEMEVTRAVDNASRKEYFDVVEKMREENNEQYQALINDNNAIDLLKKEIFMKNETLSYPDKIKDLVFNGGFGRLPKITIDDATNSFLTIIKKEIPEDGSSRNDGVLLDRINSIRDIQSKTVSINEKEMCARRFMNLVQQYAVISIGAPTEVERETLYSANLDATLAVNSASKVGVVSGMCIPTMLTAWEFMGEDLDAWDPELNKILDLYEFSDVEKVIFKDIAKDLYNASSFISRSILQNADVSEEGITTFNSSILDMLQNCLRDKKMFQPIGYDVLSFKWSTDIISPYESEKSYINAGFLTVIPFITAKLYIHPNQYFTSNATAKGEKIPDPPAPTSDSSTTTSLSDIVEEVVEKKVKTMWFKKLLKVFI